MQQPAPPVDGHRAGHSHELAGVLCDRIHAGHYNRQSPRESSCAEQRHSPARRNEKDGPKAVSLLGSACFDLEVRKDVGEDVADGRPQQSQDHDHDDGYQYQDQRVFNQALAFFLRFVQHDDFSYMINH
jgi:hypothetical protein